MAHPPLLIFLMHAWGRVVSSDLALRLPAILAGTAFCWVFFKWLHRLAGLYVALSGLVFASLLPPLVVLSAEVRQYEFLLLFAVCAAYCLERALAENSMAFMFLSAVSTYAAMLSHYSGFFFVAVLGIYALWRVAARKIAPGVIAIWVSGQVAALGLALFLYKTHISHLREAVIAQEAFNTWLKRSYYHPGTETPAVFVVAKSFSVFQFLFGQFLIGDFAALAFVAAVVLLLRGKIPLQKSGPTALQLTAFLTLPFAMNASAALLGVYPYGGTRHSALLEIFAIAGIGMLLGAFAQERRFPGIIFSLVTVAICFASPTRHPIIARPDQAEANMHQAVRFAREQIPASSLLLVDYESSMLLAHYICEGRPVLDRESLANFLVVDCGNRRIITTEDIWAFTPALFTQRLNDLVRLGKVRPGESVWVGDAGWDVSLDDSLRKELPELRDLRTYSFGKNIKFFVLSAGESSLSPFRHDDR